MGLAFVAVALALPSKPVLPTPTPRKGERGRSGLPQRPVPPPELALKLMPSAPPTHTEATAARPRSIVQ